MNNTALSMADCRQTIRSHYLAEETTVIKALVANASISSDVRRRISARPAELVRDVRANSTPTMMEKFLAQYGLTTKEGVALMCLAEALLRVPDKSTIDALIEDKISSGKWGDHRGQSPSSLINSSTWALLITGKLLSPVDPQGLANTLRGMVKRMGEPVVRSAVALGQIRVDRDEVRTSSGERIQVKRHGRDERLALPRRHLRRGTAMEGNGSDELYVVRDHVPDELLARHHDLLSHQPLASRLHRGEGLRKEFLEGLLEGIVQLHLEFLDLDREGHPFRDGGRLRLIVAQLSDLFFDRTDPFGNVCAKFRRLRSQLLVGERCKLVAQLVDLVDEWLEFLDFPFVLGADDLFQ
jgi:hypothetical protein